MQRNGVKTCTRLLVLSWALFGYGEPADVLTITVDPAGEVKTPEAACEVLRRYRADHGGRLPPGGAVITVADGTYRLTRPLALDERDSGRPGAPVIWRAATRGKACLSGMRELTAWRPVREESVLTLLPPSARTHVLEADVPGEETIPDFGGGSEECYAKRLNYPLWLYQDGRRLPLARFPNLETRPDRMKENFLFTGATVGGERNDNALGARSLSGVFVCDRPELIQWAKEPDLWVYGMFLHEYADMKMAVTNIDLNARTIALDNRWYPRGFKRDAPFYVFNALSALDTPGEWVMDRTRRKIYLWPAADVAANPPALGMTMDLVAGQALSHVRFEGLALTGARRDALRFEQATNVTVCACRVELTGAWGVRFLGGTGARVSGCDLTRLGEGGVAVSGGDAASLSPAGHTVDNCHISHYGEVIPSYRPGVSLSGVGNRCTHNLIHHSLHQGVWFNGNDHHIAYNVIHDTCLYNDDAGAVYCCQRDWTKRGTVIEYNLILQTGKRPYATHNDPVYLDDYSSGVRVCGNVVYGGTLGVHMGGGNGNEVVSNVFIACETGVHVGSRRGQNFGGVHQKGKKSLLYSRLTRDLERCDTPPWSVRYPDLLRLLALPDVFLAHDPVFNRVADNVFAASGGLTCPLMKEIGAYCVLTNNLTVPGDGAVMDCAKLDFRIRPGSEAWRKVGNLPVEQMGLYAHADRLTPPVRFGPDVTIPPAQPRRPVSPPVVRIDVATAKLPEGVAALAEKDLVNCDLLASQKGRRVYTLMKGTPDAMWKTYSFAFTPTFDAVCTFVLSGGFGGKTEYADLRVQGCAFADGDFRAEKTPWRNATGGQPNDGEAHERPYGPQKGFAIANHVRQTVQTIRLIRGKRVTVTFRARAHAPEGTPTASAKGPPEATAYTCELRDGRAVLNVSYAGRPAATVRLGSGWRGGTVPVASRAWRRSWRPVWGDRTNVVDACVEKVFAFTDAAGRRVELDVRAYDEGLAFRYRLPEGGAFDEQTDVVYPDGARAWAIGRTEEAYPVEPREMAAGPREWMTPLTVQADGVYVSLFDAYAVGYPRMRAVPFKGGVRVKRLQSEVPVLAPGACTPWRALQLATSAAQLVDHATLVLNLNPPCALADTTWIRPGLTISNLSNCRLNNRDLLETAAAEAAATGACYFQLDWGWYGTEWGWSDADRARFVKTNPALADEPTWRANTGGDPRRTAKGIVPYLPGWQRQFEVDLDFPSLIPALRKHGMALCLYVRGRVLETQDLDELFALYSRWGVAGVKPGFVRYGSAADTDWIRETVRLAAKHRLWVDIHDEAVPDGLQRTYPNLFLMEGVGGEEGKHPVHQDVSIPFARGLVGPFDYTPMVFTEGRSHAHVVAMFVCYPGPTAVMRGGSVARQKLLEDESSFAWGSERAFLKGLPWTWDESRTLDAEIGQRLVVARRAGETWYLAGLSGASAVCSEVSCDFLAPGARYQLTLWQDDLQDESPCRRCVVTRRTVTSADRISLSMAAAGGVLATFRRIPREEELTDVYYQRKCQNSLEPTFHLAGPAETTSARETVTVYTNVGEVMFFLNGRFVGAQVPNDGKTCVWRDVPLRLGENVLEFRAGQITRRFTRRRR